MSKFIVTPTAAIQFPDSGWTLTLQKQDDEIIISLHWLDKAIPTHQVACELKEFKMMIDAAGLV